MKLSFASLFLLVSSGAAFSPGSSGPSVRTTSLSNDLFDGEPGGSNNEKSKALPFVPRPKLLDGSLPGDVGFE